MCKDHTNACKGILLGALMGAAFWCFIILVFTFGE
jgi:hypothetical protein